MVGIGRIFTKNVLYTHSSRMSLVLQKKVEEIKKAVVYVCSPPNRAMFFFLA